MPEKSQNRAHQGLHGLLDEIQAAALSPLTAIPEIADSQRLKAAAERFQKSQNDLYQTLKDVYPTAILNPAERERLTNEIESARAASEAAEEAARAASDHLREAANEALKFGLSEAYVARLAGVSRGKVATWREE